MGGWMDGWVDGWVDGWMGGWMDGMGGWMGGWMDGWMDGWVDGWGDVVASEECSKRPIQLFWFQVHCSVHSRGKIVIGVAYEPSSSSSSSSSSQPPSSSSSLAHFTKTTTQIDFQSSLLHRHTHTHTHTHAHTHARTHKAISFNFYFIIISFKIFTFLIYLFFLQFFELFRKKKELWRSLVEGGSQTREIIYAPLRLSSAVVHDHVRWIDEWLTRGRTFAWKLYLYLYLYFTFVFTIHNLHCLHQHE